MKPTNLRTLALGLGPRSPASVQPFRRRGSFPYVYSVCNRPFCFQTLTWPSSAALAADFAALIAGDLVP